MQTDAVSNSSSVSD